MRDINLTPGILIIVGVIIFLLLCAHFSSDEGILGSIANIAYYLWKKFWAFIILLAIVAFFLSLM